MFNLIPTAANPNGQLPDRPRRFRRRLFAGVMFILFLAVGLFFTSRIRRQGRVCAQWRIVSAASAVARWSVHPPEANNLSGMTGMGDDRYALVSDKGGHLLWGEIKVDDKTGAVRSARILPQVAHLPGCTDAEGCAATPDGAGIAVSDETDTRLAVFDAVWGQSGDLKRKVTSARLFKDCRPNLSLESLDACADDSGYWTLNEDALVSDGPRASTRSGAWLRLEKVDAQLRRVRQWAYRSDPVAGQWMVPGVISGASDLLALPDGRLIVLERSLGVRGFRIRLYLVDPVVAAPDVTWAKHLDRVKGLSPLPKELLFEWRGWSNFEGIAFGPELADGSRSVLLVADDGDHFSTPGLLALRLERADHGWWVTAPKLLN